MDPVVVVGAGPTGLALAMELSRLGVPLRLVERRTAPDPTSRALVLQSRTLELLDARGPGPAIEAEGHPVHAAVLFGAKGRLGSVDFGSVRSTHPFPLLLPQPRTEQLLAQQAESQGVRVERGVEMIAFADTAGGSGVRVVLRHPDGGLEVVDAAYLVGADGAHSAVRHTVGVPFGGRASPVHYALGDLAAETDLPPDELALFLATNGFAALFPLGGGRFRFVGTHPHGDDPAGDPTLAELQGLYDAVASVPARFADLAWSSRFTVSSRYARRMRVGRVFLAGDAAHVHSPAGGQGMNTGIQDAVNLAWKLAFVLRGDAAPDLLDSYSAERVPVVRGIVRTTERATNLLTSTNPLVHRAVATAATVALDLDQVQQIGSSVISETRANHRASPLSVARATVAGLRAGDRVPTVGTPALAGLLDPSRFTLIVVGGATVPYTAPWEHLVVVQRADAAAGDDGLLLVRPDGYVAFSGDGTAGPALIGWLRRWLPLA